MRTSLNYFNLFIRSPLLDVDKFCVVVGTKKHNNNIELMSKM